MPHIDKNGFTLVELLVAMAVAAILGTIFFAAYSAQVQGKNIQEETTDMNQNARAAMEIMTHEIRMAGLDPTEAADARIITANVGELTFSLDRRDNAGTNRPDGDLLDPNEAIHYRLTNDGDNDGVNDLIADGTECHLGRETGAGLLGGGAGGGLQPLARNVDVLNFVYLDENGIVLATPVANTRDIRAIEVTIVVRSATDSRGALKGDYTNNDTYFNLRNAVVLPAQGDRFRRIRLATTIVCRNNF